MNYVTIVGRIVKMPTENNNVLEMAVNRSYANSDGIYETDFIPCMLPKNIASNVREFCKISDIVGAKGSLMNVGDKICVNTEKIAFLSSHKENKEENN